MMMTYPMCLVLMLFAMASCKKNPFQLKDNRHESQLIVHEQEAATTPVEKTDDKKPFQSPATPADSSDLEKKQQELEEKQNESDKKIEDIDSNENDTVFLQSTITKHI